MEYLAFEDYPANFVVMDNHEICKVSGALPPVWAIGFGLAAVFGGGFVAGYTFGRDYWAP